MRQHLIGVLLCARARVRKRLDQERSNNEHGNETAMATLTNWLLAFRLESYGDAFIEHG